MRKILSIEYTEDKLSKEGKPYVRTHALLDDGTEAIGYGDDFEIGDLVEVFFHRETVKMRKSSIDR